MTAVWRFAGIGQLRKNGSIESLPESGRYNSPALFAGCLAGYHKSVAKVENPEILQIGVSLFPSAGLDVHL